MNELSALCTVKDGKLKLFDLASFTRGLSAFGDGEELDLVIKPIGRKRTEKQNRFFHGPILKAFESLGWRKEEAKDMLCLRYLPHECRMPDNSIVMVPGHTSDLKVEEFNDFIEACIQLAAENDIVIQDAGEWRARRAHEARKAS